MTFSDGVDGIRAGHWRWGGTFEAMTTRVGDGVHRRHRELEIGLSDAAEGCWRRDEVTESGRGEG